MDSNKLTLKTGGDRMLITLDELIKGKTFLDPNTGREMTLHVAEVHSERTRIATVRAVGPKALEEGFNVGDKVVVSWHCGTRLHFMDKEVFGQIWDEDLLRVIRTEEVLATLIEE